MAKKRKAVKPFFRRRGPTGRFLGHEEVAAVEREERERAEADAKLARENPAEFAKEQSRRLRREEVRREKKNRYTRFKEHPARYSADDEKALSDYDAIVREWQYWLGTPGLATLLPPPDDIFEFGEFYEYIWVWKGQHALRTAREFLLLAAKLVPPETRGYLAMGTGKGRDDQWIGTRFGTPIEVLRHADTLLSAKSANAQAIKELFESNEDSEIWVEVKLHTKGKSKLKFKKVRRALKSKQKPKKRRALKSKQKPKKRKKSKKSKRRGSKK